MRNVKQAKGLAIVVIISVIAFAIYRFLLPLPIHNPTPDAENSGSSVLGAISGYSFLTSAEKWVMGPSGDVDMRLHIEKTQTGYRAYQGNNGTKSYSISAEDNFMTLTPEGTAISAGTEGTFDECGAWLMSTYKLTPTHWLGWYHAENTCDYETFVTHKTMAFAESFDEGLTWTKTDYPNNQIVTADSANIDPDYDDAGDGKIIVSGDYFYLFYFGGGVGAEIARSPISSEGRPGTWHKYYCTDPDEVSTCGYTEPGIGGQDTEIETLTYAGISYNTVLQRYITIDSGAKWGFFLEYTDNSDLLKWNIDYKTFLPYSSFNDNALEDNMNRTTGRHIYRFASIVATTPGIEGSVTQSANKFNLYYMKVFPFENLGNRYQFVREVEIVPQIYGKHYFVQLERYEKTGGKLKYSTDVGKYSEQYSIPSETTPSTTYLLSYLDTDHKSVYECFDTTTSAYFLTTYQPTDTWTTCLGNSDFTFIRTIGFISNNTFAGAVPQYVCFDNAIPTYFLHTSVDCNGKTYKEFLGHAYSSIIPTPVPTTALPTPTPTLTTAITPTTTVIYPACTTFIYSPWSNCSNDVQTRTVVTASPSGCGGGNPVISRACDTTQYSCTAITFSPWSTCSNGIQTRTIINSNPQGCDSSDELIQRVCSENTTFTSGQVNTPTQEDTTNTNILLGVLFIGGAIGISVAAIIYSRAKEKTA